MTRTTTARYFASATLALTALLAGCGGSTVNGGKNDGGRTDAGMKDGATEDTAVPTNACTQAGGACVAVYPGACASGITTDLACGTGIGVTCCMPGGGGGSSGAGGTSGRGGNNGAGGKNGSGGNSGTGGTTTVPVNACTQAGGACVAVYPGTCASGTVSSLSCGPGVGSECCMPGGGSADGGIDGGSSALEALCTTTGGQVTSSSCCATSSDYPDSCRSTGACGCSPANSKTISTCDCGTNHCFDQSLGCVSR